MPTAAPGWLPCTVRFLFSFCSVCLQCCVSVWALALRSHRLVMIAMLSMGEEEAEVLAFFCKQKYFLTIMPDRAIPIQKDCRQPGCENRNRIHLLQHGLSNLE